MSTLDQLKLALAEAAEEQSPSMVIHTVARGLIDQGARMILVALPSDQPFPMFYTSIQVEQVGQATIAQVINAALRAIGIPEQQVNVWATLGAEMAVRALRAQQQRQAMRQQAAKAAQNAQAEKGARR